MALTIKLMQNDSQYSCRLSRPGEILIERLYRNIVEQVGNGRFWHILTWTDWTVLAEDIQRPLQLNLQEIFQERRGVDEL